MYQMYGILFTCTNLGLEIGLKARRQAHETLALTALSSTDGSSEFALMYARQIRVKSDCTVLLCSVSVAFPGVFPLYIAASPRNIRN